MTLAERYPDIYSAPDGNVKQQIVRLLEAAHPRQASHATIRPDGSRGIVTFLDEDPIGGFIFLRDSVVIVDGAGTRSEPLSTEWFDTAKLILGLDCSTT